MSQDFYSGMLVGFAIAGVVGFFASRILLHTKRVRAFVKPQTVVQSTKKSPWQVLVQSVRSLVTILVLLGILAGSLWLAVRVVLPQIVLAS